MFSVFLIHAANSSLSKKAFPRYKMQVNLYPVSSLFLLERSSQQNGVVQKNLDWYERVASLLIFFLI